MMAQESVNEDNVILNVLMKREECLISLKRGTLFPENRLDATHDDLFIECS